MRAISRIVPRRLHRISSLSLTPRLVRSLSSLPRDICTIEVSLRRKDLISQIDEAIMSMVTLQKDAMSGLQGILEKEPSCGLANALFAFEILRRGGMLTSLSPASSSSSSPASSASSSYPDLERCLTSLNLAMSRGELTKREEYLGAAALAWANGNYRLSGALLESCLIEFPSDIIALRLAQDAYLAAGDSRNVLGCVARSIQCLDSGNFLHGHVLGMLCAGYLETGRLHEAEEVGNRAVTSTKGQDAWALHSLFNTMQLQGNSSEILAILEQHESKHEGLGLQLLRFNKGVAFIQRGNYVGAIKAYDYIFDFLVNADAHYPAAAAQATFLLWNLGLNQSSAVIDERWQDKRLVNVWNNMIRHGQSGSNIMPPMFKVCAAMAFGASAHRASASPVGRGGDGLGGKDGVDELQGNLRNENKDTLTPPNQADPSKVEFIPHSKKIWDWFRGYSAEAEILKKEAGKSSSTPNGVVEATKLDDMALKQEQAVVGPETYESLLEMFENLKSSTTQYNPHSNSNNTNVESSSQSRNDSPRFDYKHLSSLKPLHSLISTISDEGKGSYASDRDWSTRTTASPVIDALWNYSKGSYDEAAQGLLTHRYNLHRLGGTSSQRDVIEQVRVLLYDN